MKPPDRIYGHGYLLFEYMPDDEQYVLVGVVNSIGGGVDMATGKTTDEMEADMFIETGEIKCQVKTIKNI